MVNNGTSSAVVVQYVVEINGSKHSEHVYFVDAIKAALLFREQNPGLKIKVRDLSENIRSELNSELAA